ncbi:MULTISPECIES: hypothetical protein [Oceanobacillus]
MSLRKNVAKSNYIILIQGLMLYVRKVDDFGFVIIHLKNGPALKNVF